MACRALRGVQAEEQPCEAGAGEERLGARGGCLGREGEGEGVARRKAGSSWRRGKALASANMKPLNLHKLLELLVAVTSRPSTDFQMRTE